MKTLFCLASGVVGSLIAKTFGGWDTNLSTLVIFMILDYVTGLIVAVTGNSPKSENGSLNSYIGFKGIAKKIIMLILVAASYRIDLVCNIDYIRNMAIIAFIANETISIVENAGLMGVPIPKAIKKAIDILKNKGGESDEKDSK
ncbi:MAG: phage holin family protein [bacterium]|nr:phage holin family protein [bacterium]